MRGSGTILLVTHAYPPRVTQGSTRPAGLAKYLSRLGYRVVVLTAGGEGSGRVAGEPAARVIRTRDLLSTRLNWRRAHVAAHEGRAGGFYSDRPSALSGLLVPDIQTYGWGPFAVAAAGRVASEEAIDCVITTSQPRAAHLAGVRLRRSGVPWIADLRDGWRFEWPTPWRWPALHRLDARVEEAVLNRADRVVTVSDPITEDLRARLGVEGVTIANGYDPEAETARSSGVDLDPSRHSLVYTGRFAAGGRSVRAVLDGVGSLAARHPAEAARFELVLAGPMTREEADAVARGGVEPARVVPAGNLERAAARRLQREADSLLVVTDGKRTGELPGKVFEYLGARRPILVLGERSEAARLVTASSAGFAASARDPEGIAAALARLAAGETPGFEEAALDKARRSFTHQAMAERMAELVESVRGGPA